MRQGTDPRRTRASFFVTFICSLTASAFLIFSFFSLQGSIYRDFVNIEIFVVLAGLLLWFVSKVAKVSVGILSAFILFALLVISLSIPAFQESKEIYLLIAIFGLIFVSERISDVISDYLSRLKPNQR